MSFLRLGVSGNTANTESAIFEQKFDNAASLGTSRAGDDDEWLVGHAESGGVGGGSVGSERVCGELQF